MAEIIHPTFFAILSLIWLLIMVLNHAIYTDMLNKENIIHHVGVVKIQQNENLNNNEDEKMMDSTTVIITTTDNRVLLQKEMRIRI